MAYKVIILYQLYMPSYFLGTFTEYPKNNRCEKKEKRHTFWVCLSQLKLFPLLFNHHNQVFCLFPEIIFVIDFQSHITVFTGLQSIGISRMDRK